MTDLMRYCAIPGHYYHEEAREEIATLPAEFFRVEYTGNGATVTVRVAIPFPKCDVCGEEATRMYMATGYLYCEEHEATQKRASTSMA